MHPIKKELLILETPCKSGLRMKSAKFDCLGCLWYALHVGCTVLCRIGHIYSWIRKWLCLYRKGFWRFPQLFVPMGRQLHLCACIELLTIYRPLFIRSPELQGVSESIVLFYGMHWNVWNIFKLVKRILFEIPKHNFVGKTCQDALGISLFVFIA